MKPPDQRPANQARTERAAAALRANLHKRKEQTRARTPAPPAPDALPAAPKRLNPILRRLFRAPVWLYRCNCGWLFGHRLLLLIHTGRRTRLRHHTVLEVMEFRKADSEAIVMCAFGRNADWLRNIEATPDAEIVIGTTRFTAAHRVLGIDEAARVIAGYQQRNRLVAPLIRAGLSRLLGWRYDSSEPARRRAAAQMPYIAFRPVRTPLNQANALKPTRTP